MNKKMFNDFENKGITLIALVVTIVVLLILAGISISMLTGENGVITQAKRTSIKNDNGTVAEALRLKITQYLTDNQGKFAKDKLELLEDDGIIDVNQIVNVKELLGEKLKTGNGSDYKDIYVIEDNHLWYVDKDEEWTDLGDLGNTGSLEEADNEDLFIIDDEGNVHLKYYDSYYTHSIEWTLEKLVIPKYVDGKRVIGIAYDFLGQGNVLNNKILKEIVLPDGVKYIGPDAFGYCDCLENVVVPDSVIYIGDKAFYGTKFIDSFPQGDIYLGKVYYQYQGEMPNGTNIIINEGTVSICSRALSHHNELLSIEIPNSVTDIGAYAFMGCSNLEKVKIGQSVVNIGALAFNGCSNLENIDIPDSVINIEYGAFRDCNGLKNIKIGKGLSYLGDSAFSIATNNLVSISVDDQNITFDSRNNCNAIINKQNDELILGCKTTEIPDSVRSIGVRAFYKCTGLTQLNIPNSIISIEYGAFSYSGLIQVDIPNSVVYIKEYAYGKCSNLEYVTISDGVNEIGDSVFYECNKLKNVIIGNGVKNIGPRAFIRCEKLASITMGNNITSIGDYAFDSCKNLKSITIPSTVTKMGYNVFRRWTSNQTINIEFNQNEIPSGWKSDWKDNCSATIKYLDS